MSRDDLAKIDGVVTDVLSGGIFSVKLVNGKIVTAKLSGRMRKYQIRVIAGDRVSIGMSPYDLSHGLILSREKLAPSNAPPRYR
jgi:translation initiation factor IF-1